MAYKGVAESHGEFLCTSGNVDSGKIVEYTFRKGGKTNCESAENKIIPKIFSAAAQSNKKIGNAAFCWKSANNIINGYTHNLRDEKLKKGVKKGTEKRGHKISFCTLKGLYNIFVFHFLSPSF